MALKKYYQVLNTKLYGSRETPDWGDADTISAYDFENAIEKWAENYDQEGDYTIVGYGDKYGPIWVREEGEEKFAVFYVEAEQTVSYSARQTNGT